VLSYTAAFKLAQESDKPMLVLVTADWCAPCQVLKSNTLPELKAKNAFKDFYFAQVNYDVEGLLAERLIGDQGMPQLIMYQKIDGKWVKRNLAGVQTVASVESFLDQAKTIRTASAAETNSKK
jgi:thioredoxin-like negative regulator of GroEL